MEGPGSKPKEPAVVSVVAITVGYALTSSLLSIINKYAVSVFPFPGLLAMIQYLVSVLAVYFLGKAKVLEHDPLQWDKLKAFFPSALVFFLAVFSNMKVLHYANVDTFIIFRSSTPLLVAVADSLFMKRPWPSKATFVSLVVILLGAVGYVATDFQISIAAYSWATFYLITITTEMVYIKHVVSTIGLKTWGLVYYNNIFALLLSPIFILITGEGFGIAELFQPSTSENTSMQDLAGAIQLEGAKYLTLASYGPVVLSCIFGLAISFFGFSCRQALSATSFTVVGVTNKLLTVLINVTVWSKHAGPFGICMLLVCISGGVLYQQSITAPKKAEAPRPVRGDVEDQESTSLLKSASNKGGANSRIEGR